MPKSAATAAATSTTAVVKGQLANITPGVGWGHRDTNKFTSYLKILLHEKIRKYF